MVTVTVAILLIAIPCALCWDFPGYPGADCPTARSKMLQDPDVRWMIPECDFDGTYRSMQCFEDSTICMCVSPGGSPLTLPGFGLNVTTCVCFLEQYKIYEHNPESEMPKCKGDGSFEPLQCSQQTGECWCVDSDGTVLTDPSTETASCDEEFKRHLN